MAQQTLQRGVITALILWAELFATLCPLPAGADALSTSAIIATPPQPNWAELSASQHQILAPLAQDWNNMEYFRRKKWLGIAERYNRMTPDEQMRLQERMREWADLTPDQRRTVREKYKNIKRLPSEKKEVVKQKWEEYATLPDEEKQKLKDQAPATKSRRTVLPTRKVPPSNLPRPFPPGVPVANRIQPGSVEDTLVPTLPGTVTTPAGTSIPALMPPHTTAQPPFFPPQP